MKEIKRIKIDETTSNELQTMHYEINARRSVIGYMIEAKMNGGEGFKQYHKAFGEIYSEYDALKSAVAEKYLPEEYKKEGYIWQMDFDAFELVVCEV